MYNNLLYVFYAGMFVKFIKIFLNTEKSACKFSKYSNSFDVENWRKLTDILVSVAGSDQCYIGRPGSRFHK